MTPREIAENVICEHIRGCAGPLRTDQIHDLMTRIERAIESDRASAGRVTDESSPRDLAIARAAIEAAANAASDKMTDYYCENCKGGSETDMLAAIRSLDPAEIVRGVK